MLSPRSGAGSWRIARFALIASPLLMSCSDRSTEPSSSGPSSISSKNAALPVFVVQPTVMVVPTYDGSGQAVHPDIVAFDTPWHGARYWLTMTPYPRSEQTFENPSILTSNNGMTVGVPAGLRNPVIRAPRRSRDYNSDPELIYDPKGDRLVLFHRLVEPKTNTIHVTTSGDGLKWSPTPAPFWEHSHNAVSPTVAPRTGNAARMWYVAAGKAGCDTKSTHVVMRLAADASGGIVDTKWNGPYPTDLKIPGYEIWHIKARWIPSKSEYWMLIAAFPEGADCQTDDLFFARSANGLHWTTYGDPVLRHEDRDWTAAAVYRSTFLYDPRSDELGLWISARGSDGAWRMGYSRVRYTSLLAILTNGAAVTAPSTTKYPAPPQSLGEQP